MTTNSNANQSDKSDKSNKDTCFVNVHLTPQEFGVYTVIHSIAFHSGIFYMDDDMLATRFSGRKPRVYSKIVNDLAKKGWLRKVKASTRNRHGIPSATQYSVVSHDEWIRKHTNATCLKPKNRVNAETDAPECTGYTSAIPDPTEPMQQVALDMSEPAMQLGASTNAPECTYLTKEYLPKENTTGGKEGNITQHNPTSVGFGVAGSTTTSTSKTRTISENRKAETPGETLKPEATGEAEDRFLGALRQTWRDARANAITYGWFTENNSPSPSMPFVGIRKIVANLKAARRDIEDDSTLLAILEAFAIWLRRRYYPAFNTNYEIHQPLTLFAEEYGDYLPDDDIPEFAQAARHVKASVASTADVREQERQEQERQAILQSKKVDAALNAEFERRVREASAVQ